MTYNTPPCLVLWKPLVIRFCPKKILTDPVRIFYTINTQNLKESKNIFKGQKRITKGFQSNATRNNKSENFSWIFKHSVEGSYDKSPVQ